MDAGRVAIIVDPPADLDLQFINREALSVYWNSAESRVEDRYMREDSHVASFRRIASALLDEYGLIMRHLPEMRWEGLGEQARNAIERDLET
jgi:hypothetical protein